MPRTPTLRPPAATPPHFWLVFLRWLHPNLPRLPQPPGLALRQNRHSPWDQIQAKSAPLSARMEEIQTQRRHVEGTNRLRMYYFSARDGFMMAQPNSVLNVKDNTPSSRKHVSLFTITVTRRVETIRTTIQQRASYCRRTRKYSRTS